jgi:ring-1,2-phenylacetyl-CoA epoxidase subunit PaaC
MDNCLIDYTLHLADTALIMAQRQAEWCGHGPILEQDIAITNISLDLLGQSRNFYQYAATLMGGVDEDQLAYLRKEREFKSLLLAEQSNGDWGQTILKLFFVSQFQYLLFSQLKKSKDVQLAAIAEKSLKETTYHVRWSSEWVIRLGDGTAESKTRMEKAIEELWRYTGEMFVSATYELQCAADNITIDCSSLKAAWLQKVSNVFEEATLSLPEKVFMQSGGKEGIHTEQLGFILTELQYMQRTYPDSKW